MPTTEDVRLNQPREHVARALANDLDLVEDMSGYETSAPTTGTSRTGKCAAHILVTPATAGSSLHPYGRRPALSLVRATGPSCFMGLDFLFIGDEASRSDGSTGMY